MPDNEFIPVERIQSHIVVLRGHRVLLDADLARLYGVPTVSGNRSQTSTGSQIHHDPTLEITMYDFKFRKAPAGQATDDSTVSMTPRRTIGFRPD